jgi:hypothetical protein
MITRDFLVKTKHFRKTAYQKIIFKEMLKSKKTLLLNKYVFFEHSKTKKNKISKQHAN